jgi:cytochrome P450
MNPSLHKRMLDAYIPAMVRFTDEILDRWNPGNQLDMLVEMRKIAMLVLVGTLFGDNLTPEMERIFPAMLRTLRYISPGPWLFWRSMPRPGYRAAIQKMDQYLYGLIRKRRALNPKKEDLLSTLIEVSQLNDEFIRDQLLTMLIAGHDTSTALLTWVLYLLGRHSDVFQRVRFEVQSVYGDQAPLTDHSGSMVYLNQVIKETLRLYPPIHAGNRITSTELVFQGYRIPAGSRILYSIYLTHRRPQDWPEPDQFRPERFSVEQERSQRPYTYLPFGGGPRNCIGAAYAQMEARIILVRILQRFSFTLLKPEVHEHMGATLEPRPGVWMQVDRR